MENKEFIRGELGFVEQELEKQDAFEKGFISTRTDERVNERGEVFTPAFITKNMMDLDGVKEESYKVDSKWLEPSCGNGNFLIRMVARKMDAAYCDPRYAENRNLGFMVAMSNIYGIDIMDDNVRESRIRMLEFAKQSYKVLYDADMPEDLVKTLAVIFKTNIIWGDSLEKVGYKKWYDKEEDIPKPSKRVRKNKPGIASESMSIDSLGQTTAEEEPMIMIDWHFTPTGVTREVFRFPNLDASMGNYAEVAIDDIKDIYPELRLKVDNSLMGDK